LANIISIATANPTYCLQQLDILAFMQNVYQLNEVDQRKLKFLYHQSGIHTRYSAIADYHGGEAARDFIPADTSADFPLLEKRMEFFDAHALNLSVSAIQKCIEPFLPIHQITHLITISCTGMSAPGLDLQIMQALELPTTIFRTSINFMGCYAAVHGLKLAKMICDSTPNANVVMVATELCTLHFQKEFTEDNAASSLLFADGSAAVLVSNCINAPKSLSIQNFYAQVAFNGQEDMAWNLSSKGFLMKLSSYIPQLIEADIEALISKALAAGNNTKSDITHWCIHPGGKRILDLIQRKMQLSESDLQYARKVLYNYGNMSSPTVLFVLKEIMEAIDQPRAVILGMAFGPGLTMETFTLKNN
jgi:predicted naringenin-chalcone synthase